MVHFLKQEKNRQGFILLELLVGLVVLAMVGYVVWTAYSRVLIPEEAEEEPSVPPVQAAELGVDLANARMLHSTVTMLLNEGAANPTDKAVIASRIAGGYPTPQSGGEFLVSLEGDHVVVTWGENEAYSYPE